MYTFYESFYSINQTSRQLSKTTITNKVICYVNPQASLVLRLQKKFGEKYASYNKRSNKLYIRQRVRKATVKYKNQYKYSDPIFKYSFSENYTLDLNIIKGGD